MLKLLGRRLVSALWTLWGASLVAFVLIRLVPGDPVTHLLGERGASPEVVQHMRTQLGLDRPVVHQYFLFISQALRGDFGVSIVSRESVLKEFKSRFPATAELALAALLLATLCGVPMGVWAAVRRGRLVDRWLMGASLVGYSMPIFWWGLLLILFFSVGLGWTPVSGRMSLMIEVPEWSGFLLLDSIFSPEGFLAFKEALRHLFLPAICLGTVPLAALARMTRSSLLEVLQEDYIRTARAKGLTSWQIVGKHALANALIPILTVFGLMLGTLLTGAILTETIFSWPGLGKWIVASVLARDYPVIQGGVLLISALIVLVNLCIDLAYIKVNPLLRTHE